MLSLRLWLILGNLFETLAVRCSISTTLEKTQLVDCKHGCNVEFISTLWANFSHFSCADENCDFKEMCFNSDTCCCKGDNCILATDVTPSDLPETKFTKKNFSLTLVSMGSSTQSKIETMRKLDNSEFVTQASLFPVTEVIPFPDFNDSSDNFSFSTNVISGVATNVVYVLLLLFVMFISFYVC